MKYSDKCQIKLQSPMELSSPKEFHGFLEDSIPSKHIPTQSGTCKLETS